MCTLKGCKYFIMISLMLVLVQSVSAYEIVFVDHDNEQVWREELSKIPDKHLEGFDKIIFTNSYYYVGMFIPGGKNGDIMLISSHYLPRSRGGTSHEFSYLINHERSHQICWHQQIYVAHGTCFNETFQQLEGR